MQEAIPKLRTASFDSNQESKHSYSFYHYEYQNLSFLETFNRNYVLK